jgi:hypothetical protein
MTQYSRPMSAAIHVEEIAGDSVACFAAAIDFESYPDWQSLVRSVEVRSTDAAGRAREVEFEVDLKLRRVRYALIYEYTEPSEIRWTYAGGDAKDVTGSYSFLEGRRSGMTTASYTLDIDLGVPVPPLVRNRLQRDFMRRSVRELKRRVERG